MFYPIFNNLCFDKVSLYKANNKKLTLSHHLTLFYYYYYYYYINIFKTITVAARSEVCVLATSILGS
jgi:hypothetical protein